MQAAP
jgi:hypothetical protein